jgi:hypothetical protein
MVGDMHDILNIWFSRVDRDVAGVRQSVAEIAGSVAENGQRLTFLERTIDALPCVLAEMLDEHAQSLWTPE